MSEEEKVLLTGAPWQEMAWTEMSFSITFTLTGVFRGDSARRKSGSQRPPKPSEPTASGRRNHTSHATPFIQIFFNNLSFGGVGCGVQVPKGMLGTWV